jgi:hypothetical protein
METAQDAARLLTHNTRHEAAWEDERGELDNWHGQCGAYWCSHESYRESDWCLVHQSVGAWYGEAVEPEHPANLGWYRDQLASPERQASQACKALFMADEVSSRAAVYALAVLAIRALRRLPLEGSDGNGFTWRDSLEIAVARAQENRS